MPQPSPNKESLRKEAESVHNLIKKDALTPHQLYLWAVSMFDSHNTELISKYEEYVDNNVADEHFNRNWLKAHFKEFFINQEK